MYICAITPGVDSSLSYFYLKEKIVKDSDVQLVYIPISHKYSDIEISRIKLMEPYFKEKVIIYPFDNQCIYESHNAFIAGRNLLIASLIESTFLVRPLRIVFGFTKDDRVYDSGKDFMDKLSELQSDGVSVMSPAINLSKHELVKWFFEEYQTDFDKNNFSKLLYSCYNGDEKPCGKCKACIRMATALYPYVDMQLHKDTLPELEHLLNDKISDERKQSISEYIDSHF